MAALDLKRLNLHAAEAYLREAVSLAPQMADYHATLARALNQEGETREAEEELKLEASLRQKTIRERRSDGL